MRKLKGRKEPGSFQNGSYKNQVLQDKKEEIERYKSLIQDLLRALETEKSDNKRLRNELRQFKVKS